ncbi:MAG: hypothetical protein UR43_C0020G0008 [candidate division TM6 bacterium GW2011_GWF2_33_332]|nr:MAG: hypothetical protein UR43_C0020G0008 [candidate division TM6 bacterium GW2011_GWF2_33_332]
MEKIIIDNFLKKKDFRNAQFSMSIIGESGGGKTYLINYFIKKLKEYYDMVVYYSGSTIIEADKIEGIIYLDFEESALVLEQIEELKKLNSENDEKIKTLFIFDDCVFNMDRTNNTIKLFKLLFMNNRHIPLSVIFSSQRINSELFPFIKMNSQFIIVKNMNNAKALKSIYDDYFSIHIDDFSEFKTYYKEKVLKKKYYSLVITKTHGYLIDGKFKIVDKLF